MKQHVIGPVSYYRRQIFAAALCGLLLCSMIAYCATEADVNGATAYGNDFSISSAGVVNCSSRGI